MLKSLICNSLSEFILKTFHTATSCRSIFTYMMRKYALNIKNNNSQVIIGPIFSQQCPILQLLMYQVSSYQWTNSAVINVLFHQSSMCQFHSYHLPTCQLPWYQGTISPGTKELVPQVQMNQCTWCHGTSSPCTKEPVPQVQINQCTWCHGTNSPGSRNQFPRYCKKPIPLVPRNQFPWYQGTHSSGTKKPIPQVQRN